MFLSFFEGLQQTGIIRDFKNSMTLVQFVQGFSWVYSSLLNAVAGWSSHGYRPQGTARRSAQ
jgi:hypothetical protein